MIIYGLKNCDACKAFLKAQPDFELIDVSITPVPENILKKAIENFGEELINKRSMTWRKLDIETRQKQPQEIIRLHPKVMKRPLVRLKSGELSLGYKASKG
jgi:arsenate reductase